MGKGKISIYVANAGRLDAWGILPNHNLCGKNLRLNAGDGLG